MKCLVKLVAVEKQEVRAQREVELFIVKWQRRQLGSHVPTLSAPSWVIAEEQLHGCHACLAEYLDRRDGAPDEFMLVLPRLFHDCRVSVVDSAAKV
ncbi:MAG: hypothetical protein ERJ69_02880 [Aphanocapsa feldmannii 288cV]|nr:MAG: hypothetical protein ERJ69_02880 [Aphanocapsa feldmannii 288cV]